MNERKREALYKRIRRIAEMTVANGCSEAEALSAANMLAAILSEHGLAMSDVEIEQSTCEAHGIAFDEALHAAESCVPAIERLTDTMAYGRLVESQRVIYFFGLPADARVASYLLTICYRAINNDAAAFRQDAARRRLERLDDRVASFQFGMASRLAERLFAMKVRLSTYEIAGTGRDLIPLKQAVVKREAEAAGLKSSVTWQTVSVHADDFAAGQAAGDKVPLNQGLPADVQGERVGQTRKLTAAEKAEKRKVLRKANRDARKGDMFAKAQRGRP